MSTQLHLLCRSLSLMALLLVGPSAVYAEPSQSLADKRLSIFKGESKGIVLFGSDAAPRPAASAPARSGTTGTGAVAAGADATPAEAAQPAATGSRFLSSLPPPSGRSLQSARRLDAPDQGVALPTARAASQPQAEPAAKR
jgi:hypothetical protein